MAAQADRSGHETEGDLYLDLNETFETHGQSEDTPANIASPPPQPCGREREVLGPFPGLPQDDQTLFSNSCQQDDNDHTSRFEHNGVSTPVDVAYTIGDHSREGATTGCVEGLGLNDALSNPEIRAHELREISMNRGTPFVDDYKGCSQLHQTVAANGRRKKRKLRRRRAEPALQGTDQSMPLQNHVVFDDSPQNHDAVPHQTERRASGCQHLVKEADLCHDAGRDPSCIQLQSEMEAATITTIDQNKCYDEDHDSRINIIDMEILQQHNQRPVSTSNSQYFEQTQVHDGLPEIYQNQAGGIPPDQCPSSDIIGDAAQEFENRIYRRQQARSAKHQADRSAWQNLLQQELIAKQVLEDRLNTLQREKDELTVAVEKQKIKTVSCQTMANKLKTFIGGLANDMGALRRDASTNRQDCKDIGEATKENKAVLDDLLHQLSRNAERSSQLKNEAIEACRVARSDMLTARTRTFHLEEQLREKTQLLAEEKSLREQILTQADSTANFGDTMVRLLKSSERSVLEKVSELAAAVTGVGSGKTISEQLENVLAAVQGLNSKQTATVNDILSVKGVVERLSESLNQFTDSIELPTGRESALKTYIGGELSILKSELCQQEKLAVQDAEKKQTISFLHQKIEEVNARMTECESTLSLARVSETQLKEQNMSLQAKIANFQGQIRSGEQDSAQLTQLKAELDLKVIALQTTTSELDTKASALHSMTVINEDLQSRLDALNLRLNDIPSITDMETERIRLQEKHRQDIECAKNEASAVITKVKALELSDAANALKKTTAEHTKALKKLTSVEQELALSKQELNEFRGKHASEISGMQKKIDSAEVAAAAWKKEIESETLNRKTAQQAAEEVHLLKSQLSAENEAVRKAAQEKGSLLEKIRQLRQKSQEDEDRLNGALQQCRTDSEKFAQSMKAELRAAEERSAEVMRELQSSAEVTMEAEKEKYDKQIKALQKRVYDAQSDLQIRIKSDEDFREELQKSWQSEERNNQTERKQLSGQILEAEKQRDQAIAENERLREDLLKAQSSSISKAAGNPVQESSRLVEGDLVSDPRLHNRHTQPKDGAGLRDAKAPSQASGLPEMTMRTSSTTSPAAGNDMTELSTSDPTHARGPVVDESQLAPYRDVNAFHPTAARSRKEDMHRSRKFNGSVIERPQQPRLSVSSDLGAEPEDYQSELPWLTQSTQEPVFDEPQQHTIHGSSQLMTDGAHTGQRTMPFDHQAAYRELFGEDSQRHILASSREQGLTQPWNLSQHQSSLFTRGANRQSEPHSNAENEILFVPETQVEPETHIEKPSFANSNAASTMQEERERKVTSDTFSGPADRTIIARPFRKTMPPPNTASRRVRTDAESSSLSSLSSLEHRSSSPSAAARTIPTTTTRQETPELRPFGGKAQRTQSIMSGSSDGFIGQMANARSKITYHSGGSGKKTDTYQHSNQKHSRASAPKRKAQSQVVQGYEQERKKMAINHSSQGNEPSHSGHDDGYTLSQMMASQNKGLQAPGSLRDAPRASGRSARMRTLAGGGSVNSTRQTRNSTRKLSKNEEMDARFARELGAAR